MCKGLGIALAIMCLFYAPASLFAQNTPANLYFRDNPYKENLLKPLTPTVVFTEVKTYSPTITRDELNLLVKKQPHAPIKDENLIYECWVDMKSHLKKPAQSSIKNLKPAAANRNVFNALYNKHKVDEKKRLRLAWKEAFNIDVWYPYFKVMEIEDWFKERTSVRIFKLKGKPKFENDQVLYVFKTAF